MTNREIYEAALSHLAQVREDACEDYEERAPYLLAAFVNECRGMDAFYSAAHGRTARQDRTVILLDLDENFPLDDRFCHAAAFYVAALLVEVEDEELSDRLFARYADAVSRIANEETPAGIGQVRDVYRFVC